MDTFNNAGLTRGIFTCKSCNTLNTKQAIYLIIDNGHPKALEHFIAFYNELDKEIKRKISYFIIDATMRPSASKA